jgi:hypothetical protein
MCGDLGKTGMERPARALSRGWGKPRGHSEQEDSTWARTQSARVSCLVLGAGKLPAVHRVSGCKPCLFLGTGTKHRQQRKAFSQIIGSLHFIVVFISFRFNLFSFASFHFYMNVPKIEPRSSSHFMKEALLPTSPPPPSQFISLVFTSDKSGSFTLLQCMRHLWSRSSSSALTNVTQRTWGLSP